MGNGLMSGSDAHEQPGSQQTDAAAELCRWRVVAASVRGTSHEKTGQPCQDAHFSNVLLEDVLVAAVADGAGSAALGEVGATVAARKAVETICAQGALPRLPGDDGGWRLLLIDALKAARTEVEAEAAARKVTARDLATTLILLVVTPELVAVVQVGDGATVAGDAEGNVIPLTAPQNGEYINETTFLISPEALDTAQVTVWHGVAAQVAALSDGLQ